MEQTYDMEGWRALLGKYMPMPVPEVRMAPIDKSAVVAGAAASDLNDELTVIMTCVCGLLAEAGPGHPAREELLNLRCAAQRCAWTAASLLNYASRRGAKPSHVTTDDAIDWAEGRK